MPSENGETRTVFGADVLRIAHCVSGIDRTLRRGNAGSSDDTGGAQEGVTEQLKAENQMEWVICMNSIRSRAEEIVWTDLTD